MSEKGKSLRTWEEVIAGFLSTKAEAEEEKYLKDGLKSVGEQYKKMQFFNNDEIEYLFDTRKNKKEKNEASLDFHRRRALAVLTLEDKPSGLNLYRQKKDYFKKIKEVTKKYDPINWLSINCENASSVSFATHVIKLTHSKIGSPSLFDCVDEYRDSYLTTSALKTKVIDGAVAGNQFAPIFQFLELELNGVKLAEQLSKDNRFFECFVQDNEVGEGLLTKWRQGFRKALDSGTPSTHSLAKQIYFYIKGDRGIDQGGYHLLCNVISSSLAHAIHEKVFDDARKPVKKAQEKEKFSPNELSRFIRRSTLSVTASNHSNASQLNAKRGGKLHLFSTQPPTWHSQLAPVYRKSLFSDFYNTNIKTDIDYLREFLLRFGKLDLSIKDPKRMQHLERWVNTIIDEFLFYAGTIQNLPSGWSGEKDIRLKKEHQYFLDPYHADEGFQADRLSSDWQMLIRADFARWLNRQLRGKDKQFTPQKEHTRLWKSLSETPLREFMEPIEIEMKQRMRESL